MHILFATSEVSPFSQGSGLADVMANLPAALKSLGHHVSIITPLYDLDPVEHRLAERLKPVRVKIDGQSVDLKVYEGRTPEHVRVFFVAGEVFGRGPRDDKADDGLRFGVFSRAICEFIRINAMRFDLLHLNDWQTAMAPVFLEERYADSPQLADLMVVLTLHDLAHQGAFPPSILKRIDLPSFLADPEHIEVDGKVNFLTGGILFSDAIATMSPTYAQEILTEDGGHGIDDILDERRDDLVGIIHGIDTSRWDPTSDPLIPRRYKPQHLNGKRQSKASLQKLLKLAMRPHAMLLGVISRFESGLGMDLVLDAAEEILALEDIQLAVLGEGDPRLEKAFRKLAEKYSRQVTTHIGITEPLAHRFIAGVDTLLIPSKSEPGGVSQLRALRYGTLPIARRTGGLADTIEDIDTREHTGTGFLFDEHSVDGLMSAVRRAHKAFQTPRDWRTHQLAAMAIDSGWTKTAEAYSELYNSLL